METTHSILNAILLLMLGVSFYHSLFADRSNVLSYEKRKYQITWALFGINAGMFVTSDSWGWAIAWGILTVVWLFLAIVDTAVYKETASRVNNGA